MPTKKVNFFIIGAPKCGTTALSEYLRDHSAVFMSTPKEPSYFCFDYPGLQYVSLFKDYERLFISANESHISIGEASPSYLFSHQAISEIYKYNPNARIITMLRNPIDMLPSYHSQLVYSSYEDQTDFRKAWELQADRLKGKHIPKKCREPKTLQYGEVAKFADQLERVFSIFPRKQVLVLFFDDFKNNPRQTYEDVLKFLGLTTDNRTEFPVINPNKSAHSDAINKFLHSPPKWALNMMGAISGSKLHDSIIKIHDILKSTNTKASTREALESNFREELSTAFYTQVIGIEQLTGRDLSQWKAPSL